MQQAAEQIAEQVAEQVAEQAAEQETEQAAEQVAEPAAKPAAEQLPWCVYKTLTSFFIVKKLSSIPEPQIDHLTLPVHLHWQASIRNFLNLHPGYNTITWRESEQRSRQQENDYDCGMWAIANT
jgi:hypothetical protein